MSRIFFNFPLDFRCIWNIITMLDFANLCIKSVIKQKVGGENERLSIRQ